MKPTRKRISFWVGRVVFGLFFVAVLTFLVWRIRLSSRVNRQLEAIKAAGFPTSGTELNSYYAPVPDDENAALVLTQAFALIREFPDQRSNTIASFKLPPSCEPLTLEENQLISEYATLNSAALERAQHASSLRKSRYPVNFSANIHTKFPHLSALKSLARAASCRAILACNSDDREACADSIEQILELSRTLDDEPAVMSQAHRVILLSTAALTLERALCKPILDESALRSLASAFSRAEKTNLMLRAMIAERAAGLPYFRNGLDGKKATGLPLPAAVFRAIGFFDRDLDFYLRIMETNIALRRLPPPQSLVMTNVGDQAFDESKRKYYYYSMFFLPGESKATVAEAQGLASVRLSKTGLAIERFRIVKRRLPDDLQELTPRWLPSVLHDPFDGAQIRYRRTERGYSIYSVGSDGLDNGGNKQPVTGTSLVKSGYDITFTVER